MAQRQRAEETRRHRRRRRADARHEPGRGQEDDRDRQGARLHHLRRAERGPAPRPGHLRADRGRDGHALRDGHQRHRERRGRRRGRRPRRRAAEPPRRAARASSPSTSVGGEALDRTDDPVRMYLREMGSVELLSREGEIAIAKRIEAGRNTMIAGLCESPLTFQAITIWRDELLDEAIMLRDVIDLETTFSGLDGDRRGRERDLRPEDPPAAPAPAAAAPAPEPAAARARRPAPRRRAPPPRTTTRTRTTTRPSRSTTRRRRPPRPRPSPTRTRTTTRATSRSPRWRRR